MLELIALFMTGFAAVGGYLSSRRFVRRRLRFVTAVQRAGAPLMAGTGAALAAAPVVWILPLVGSGTALVFGMGVAAGVSAGVRDLRNRLPSRS